MSRKRRKAQTFPLVPATVLAREPGYFQKTLVCDLHGVIVDFLTPFLSFVSRKLGRKLGSRHVRLYRHWQDPLAGLSPVEFQEQFEQFLPLAVGGYGDLKPYPGAIEGLKAIHRKGVRIMIWTWTPGVTDSISPAGSHLGVGTAQAVTRRLIEQLKLPVNCQQDLVFMSPAQKPVEMARRHIPLIWDDNPTTAIETASGFGLGCFMPAHSYNRSIWCPGVTRLDHNSLAGATLKYFERLAARQLLIKPE